MQSRKQKTEHPLLNASTLAILDGYQLLASRGNSKSRTDLDPDATGTFCGKCSQFLQDLKSWGFGVGDDREISALEEGAKNGCQACSMFQVNLSSLTEEWLQGFEGKPRLFITLVPNFRIPYFLQPEAMTPLKFVGYKEKGDV
jgi:hypothetical protein